MIFSSVMLLTVELGGQKKVLNGQAYQFFIFDKFQNLLGSITIENIRKGPSNAGTLGYWLGKEQQVRVL